MDDLNKYDNKSKRYFAIRRLFLIPDLGNTQETQEFCWKKAYKARQKQYKQSRTLQKVFLDPDLTGPESRKLFCFDAKMEKIPYGAP